MLGLRSLTYLTTRIDFVHCSPWIIADTAGLTRNDMATVQYYLS